MYLKHVLNSHNLSAQLQEDETLTLTPAQQAAVKAAHGRTIGHMLKKDRLTLNAQMTASATPFVFTRSMRASITTDQLILVGTGKFNPADYIRLFTAYTRVTSSTLQDLLGEMEEVLKNLSHDSTHWRHILGGIVGADRRRPSSSAPGPRVTPSMVLDLVTQQFPDAHLFVRMLFTDFVCTALRETSWIISDEPYVYKLTRGSIFPSYDDLVDVVHLSEIAGVFNALADVKVDFLKDVTNRSGGLIIDPTYVALQLTQSTHNAYYLTRHNYDPVEVVDSVLTQLVRMWMPQEIVPDQVKLSERLSRNSLLSELSQNLALFNIAQTRLQQGALDASQRFTDEHMISEIIGLFHHAVTNYSPFKVDILSNVINHVGKKTARDHLDRPVEMILYEDWNYKTETAAFSTVKHLNHSSNGVFLIPENNATTALESALKPISDFLSMTKLVDQRIESIDLKYASDRMAADGTYLTIALASENYGLSTDGPDLPLVERAKISRAFDTLSVLTHLAVAKSHSVSITAVDHIDHYLPMLRFHVMTDLVEPMGLAAIHQGEVVTWEPLEALVYTNDFDAVKPLVASTLDISSKESMRAVHLWDVKSHSETLGATTPYATSIKNRQINVDVYEWEALGLGIRRKAIYFLKPLLTRAHISHWVNWNREELLLLSDYAKSKPNDTIVQTMVEGRKRQLLLSMAINLATIGSKTIGRNISSAVKHKIVEDLYAAGQADDANALQIGVEANKLMIWSGLASMLLVEAIEASDAQWIYDQMNAADVLAMMVAANITFKAN